jgi:hypothetical protein
VVLTLVVVGIDAAVLPRPWPWWCAYGGGRQVDVVVVAVVVRFLVVVTLGVFSPWWSTRSMPKSLPRLLPWGP